MEFNWFTFLPPLINIYWSEEVIFFSLDLLIIFILILKEASLGPQSELNLAIDWVLH